MPVADEQLYLYKIEMRNVKSHSTSRSYDLSQNSPLEIELGILSRKQFPKVGLRLSLGPVYVIRLVGTK